VGDDVATLVHDSDCRSVLLGLVSAADDPTSSIEAAASKLKIGEPQFISVIFTRSPGHN